MIQVGREGRGPAPGTREPEAEEVIRAAAIELTAVQQADGYAPSTQRVLQMCERWLALREIGR